MLRTLVDAAVAAAESRMPAAAVGLLCENKSRANWQEETIRTTIHSGKWNEVKNIAQNKKLPYCC